MTVPDVPSAIAGWRTWRVGRRAARRADLVAPLAGVLWPPRQPMVATCGSPHHAPPGERCRCGLYAVADPATLEWGPSDHEVLGVVALWGEIVEGTRGWRASHAYPRLLITGPGVPAEQRDVLARRYGVDVHGSEVPPRVVASALGRAAADRVRHGSGDEAGAVLTAAMPDLVRRWDDRRRARVVTSSSGSRIGAFWRRKPVRREKRREERREEWL